MKNKKNRRTKYFILIVAILGIINFMTIKKYICIMQFVLSILSLVVIIMLSCNDDKNVNKYLISVSILSIIYLGIIGNLSEHLPIVQSQAYLSLSNYYIWRNSIVISIIYLIIIIACKIKDRKLVYVRKNANNLIKKFIFILFFPCIVFLAILFKEIYLISNSEIILMFHSYNDNLSASYGEIIYVANDKYCKEISLDVLKLFQYKRGIFLSKYIHKISKEVLYTNKDINFKFKNSKLSGRKILYIYKNEKILHKVPMKYYINKLEYILYNSK